MASRKKRKTGFWGFIISIIISVIIIALYGSHPQFIEIVELKLFDLRYRYKGHNSAPGHEVAIAAIDQKSIDQLTGRSILCLSSVTGSRQADNNIYV